MNPLTITILGDGGWGTAVACILGQKGHRVRLWGHDPAYLQRMESIRENEKFLPGVLIPEAVCFEPAADAALAEARVVVVAIPTRYLRPTLQRIARDVRAATGAGPLPAGAAAVSLTKGLEKDSLQRPSLVTAAELGAEEVAVLSGPSHAEEVARGLPASVTIASSRPEEARLLQEVFMTPTFRVYTSADTIGVELGGALKNVIALAAGLAEGLELGDNARAALMTRGLAEMTRFGVACGGTAETFAGLSGVGDLITTCVSGHGRNRAAGLALAAGKSFEEIVDGAASVAEGLFAAPAVRDTARELGVEMPITGMLCRLLEGEVTPQEAVGELMTRAPKAERPLSGPRNVPPDARHPGG
jgi:glycerol-3-phosphate dehydrogenase (NAD(P)+)